MIFELLENGATFLCVGVCVRADEAAQSWRRGTNDALAKGPDHITKMSGYESLKASRVHSWRSNISLVFVCSPTVLHVGKWVLVLKRLLDRGVAGPHGTGEHVTHERVRVAREDGNIPVVCVNGVVCDTITLAPVGLLLRMHSRCDRMHARTRTHAQSGRSREEARPRAHIHAHLGRQLERAQGSRER